MSAPSSLERLRIDTEHRLRNYVLLPVGCRWVIARQLAPGRWMDERVCTNREDAEAYLCGKLPTIAPTRGDRVRFG